MLSVQDGESSQVYILKHNEETLTTTTSWSVGGETTSLCICRVSGQLCAIIASATDASPVISVYSLQGEVLIQQAVHKAAGQFNCVEFR
jgi:hypothetical protein